MTLRKAGLSLTLQGKAEYLAGLRSINNAYKVSAERAKAAVIALDKNGSAVQAYRTRMNALNDTHRIASEKASTLAKRQQEIPKSLANIKSEMSRVTQAYSESAQKTSELKQRYSDLSSETDKYAKQTKVLSEAYKASKREFGAHSDEAKKAKAALNEAQAAEKAHKATLAEVSAQLKVSQGDTKGLASSMNELEREFKETTVEAGRLPLELAKSQTEMAKLQAERQRLHTEFRQNGGRFADLANGFTERGDQMIRWGDNLKQVGGWMTSRVTAPIVAGFAGATKAAATFHSEVGSLAPLLSNGGPITGEIKNQMGQLGALSRKMAIEYGKNTSEINRGMSELVRNGYSTQQVMGMIPNMLNASIASGDSFNDVMRVSSQVLSQFNLRGKDYNETMKNSSRVTDSLTYIANATSAGFAELGEGMAYVGPVANSLNMSVEETASILGVLSDNGIEASKGGTALRGALTRLLKPSDQNVQAFKELGINVEAFKNGSLKLPDIIDKIRENTKGWTDEQRAAALATAFGTEAQTAMNTLVSQGGDALRGMAKEAENVSGATKKIADSMKELPEFQFQKLLAQLKDVGIEVGTKLLPHVLKAVETIGKLADSFGKLSPGMQESLIKFGLFSAAVGPVLSMFGNLSNATGLVTKGIGSMIRKFGEWTTPKVIEATTEAIEGTVTALGSVEGAAGSAGGAASLFSNPWVIAGGVAVAAVAGVGLALLHEAQAPFAAHQESVSETQGAYQTWFDAVTQGVKSISEMNSEAQKNADETTENYKKNVAEVMQQNREVQDMQSRMWSESEWWKNTLYNNFQYIELGGKKVAFVFDDMRKKMHELGQEDAFNKMIPKIQDYTTTLGNSIQNTIKQFNAHTVVTDGWANGQIAAIKRVTEDVKANYEEQKQAEIQALEAKRTNLNKSQAWYDEELAKINSMYQQKQSVIQNAEANISRILSTAASEHRTLTEKEVLSMIKSYQQLGESAGQSLSQIPEAMNLIGDNLSLFVSSFGLDFLKSAGLIDEATAKMIAGLGTTEERTNALKKALEGIDDVEPTINTDSMVQAIETLEQYNGMTIQEKIASLSVLGKDEIVELLKQLGVWDSLDPKQQEAIMNAQGTELVEEAIHAIQDWNTLSPEDKAVHIESQVANEQLRNVITEMDLFNNTEFQNKFIQIDTSAPDAQEKIIALVNEYRTTQGLPPIDISTMTNASETTSEVEGLSTAVSNANNNTQINVSASSGGTVPTVENEVIRMASTVDANANKSVNVTSNLIGMVANLVTMGAYKVASDSLQDKSVSANTQTPNMTSNTGMIVSYNTEAGKMKNTQATASTNAPSMSQNTSMIVSYNTESGRMKNTSSTASTYTPNIGGNTSSVQAWNSAVNAAYSKAVTFTTYHDKVYRTYGSAYPTHATGGHIGMHATGGHIPMFANGAGIVPVGYTGIVGEAGPEIFQVSKRGVTITPLSTSEKMRGIEEVIKDVTGGGGQSNTGVVTINVNIDGPTFRSEDDIDTLVRKVKDALTSEALRNKFMMKGDAVGHA